jgi:lipopolysaccharide/colanic/teichoic acid biosynthesis glycosyltransferase
MAAPAPAKRAADVALSCLALVIVAPLLMVCVVLIKCADPGPALYWQWRVGRGGRLFRLWKLRTMRQDAERDTGAVYAESDDTRVIGVCRPMRRSHVDELPQLFNILCGQMSLVGPRPERPDLVNQITRDLPQFVNRLTVRPGLTGLAQLCNGYTDDLEGARLKLDYDMHYIGRMSLWQDLKLMVQTLPRFWDGKAH